MSEENEKNKPQIILGGVSGNKELKVRRVHKKKTEQPSEPAAPVKEEVKEAAPKKEAPAKAAPAAQEEAPKAAPKKEAEAPAAKPAAEKKDAPIDRRKISSAVVAMPETVRSSTVISDNRGG